MFASLDFRLPRGWARSLPVLALLLISAIAQNPKYAQVPPDLPLSDLPSRYIGPQGRPRSCGNILKKDQIEEIHGKLMRDYSLLESCLPQTPQLGRTTVNEVLSQAPGIDSALAAWLVEHRAGPSSKNGLGSSAPSKVKAIIRVRWYVINEGDSPLKGHITIEQMNKSIALLNNAYAPVNLEFVLETVKYKTHPTWFYQVGAPDKTKQVPQTEAMKKEFKVSENDPSILRVFTVKLSPTGNHKLFGFSQFPWDYESYPYRDGVVIGFWTLPDAPRMDGKTDLANPLNGTTLIHEVGHWAGLYHPFEGDSCDGRGDYVDDTPVTDTALWGCPTSAIICGTNTTSKGIVNNYMSYVDDNCAHSFTDGQVERMRMMLALYRRVFT